MIELYPKYNNLASYWIAAKLGNIKTYQFSKDISLKIFPKSQIKSIDDLNTLYLQNAKMYSKSSLSFT